MPVLARYVIVLAYEFVVFQYVQLLAGRQLFPAYHARETVEVKNFVPGFPHQVSGRYPLGATIALFAIPPVVTTKQKSLNYTSTPLLEFINALYIFNKISNILYTYYMHAFMSFIAKTKYPHVGIIYYGY